jgi:hypothetical protein
MNEVLDTKEGPYVKMEDDDQVQSMMFLAEAT